VSHAPGDEAARNRLASRLDRALSTLPEPPATPTVVVDLDAFDANATDLARRAGGKPVRVATKSLRVPALVARALAAPGFRGVLAYALREALWLHEQGVCDDIVMGYPTLDAVALRALTADPAAARGVTLMVDDPAHLDAVDAARPSGPPVEIRIAIDVDAGLRLGTAHVGPKRSPLHDSAQVVALARDVVARPGFSLVGVMTYEGQVAGVPDAVPHRRARSLAVRRPRPCTSWRVGAPRSPPPSRAWSTSSSGTRAAPAASSRRPRTRPSPR
jgi:D-serine deaminase-like pyridoxal phosphate-dependent protein